MALATICPHCDTTFRVASDQLKLRGGIVRCGACNEVFDGNAALIDLDAAAPPAARPELVCGPVADTGAPDQAASESTAGPAEAEPSPESEAASDAAAEPVVETSTTHDPQAGAAPEPSASAAFDAEAAEIDVKQADGADEPSFTLDFDTTFDPFGIMPKPEPEPAQQRPVDEEIVLPAPDDGDEALDATLDVPPAPVRDEPDLLASLLMRESASAEPALAAPQEAAVAAPNQSRRNARKRNKPAPPPVAAVEPEPEPAPEDDEPEFVRRIRLREETGRTRRMVMGAASALLVLALAAQAMTTFRNVLAARYPSLKPVIVTTCDVFGCKVELPAQIDMLGVETGELQSLDANTFSYTTLLRNQGSLVQAWPHIELALTDANGKPVVRRVFAPAEYLPAGVAPAKGFGPRSEQAVKLSFELNQVKASGYHIAIFYP